MMPPIGWAWDCASTDFEFTTTGVRDDFSSIEGRARGFVVPHFFSGKFASADGVQP
jgi:hypothetical protein